jgi:hypothetical protein
MERADLATFLLDEAERGEYRRAIVAWIISSMAGLVAGLSHVQH